jgi:hypothetical protein
MMEGQVIPNRPPWDEHGLSIKVGNAIAVYCAALAEAEQRRIVKNRKLRLKRKFGE